MVIDRSTTPAGTDVGLRPHPDRLFSSDPAQRELYALIHDLPLICPHGNVDPALLAANAPFPDPADLLVVPDHYLLRMLYSQGVTLEQLGVPGTDGRPLLNRFGDDPRVTLVVFTLDELTYSRELAPLAGHYPAMRLGPAWWFHDSPEGMRRLRELTTETAVDLAYHLPKQTHRM